jgi:bifunctional non-homologous end joining protein LigD
VAYDAGVAHASDAPIPHDPLEWRPQVPLASGVRGATIEDPILEPHWSGRHVLAHFDSLRGTADGEPWLRLVDTEGSDVTADEPVIGAALRGAIMASDAVVDGFLTAEATRTGQGASVATTAEIPRFQLFLPRPADVDVTPIEGHDRGGLVAFVAVDLLQVDGQPLFDVPLLERKRLLESVIQPADLVRISVYTRPPLQPWLTSWRAAGLAGVVMKSANSRYRPARESTDWTVVLKTSGRS